MNVDHPCAGLFRTQHDAVELRYPVLCTRDWVHGNFTQITGLRQIVEGLRRRLFVQSVMVDGVAQGPEVRMQDRLLRMQNYLIVLHRGDTHEDGDDRDDDHQLNEREPCIAAEPARLPPQRIICLLSQAYLQLESSLNLPVRIFRAIQRGAR